MQRAVGFEGDQLLVVLRRSFSVASLEGPLLVPGKSHEGFRINHESSFVVLVTLAGDERAKRFVDSFQIAFEEIWKNVVARLASSAERLEEIADVLVELLDVRAAADQIFAKIRQTFADEAHRGSGVDVQFSDDELKEERTRRDSIDRVILRKDDYLVFAFSGERSHQAHEKHERVLIKARLFTNVSLGVCSDLLDCNLPILTDEVVSYSILDLSFDWDRENVLPAVRDCTGVELVEEKHKVLGSAIELVPERLSSNTPQLLVFALGEIEKLLVLVQSRAQRKRVTNRRALGKLQD